MEFYSDSMPSGSQDKLALSPKQTSELKILTEPIDAVGKIGSYVNFSARIQANDPQYQWYDKNGVQIPRMCNRTLAIGPIKEEDFGFYRLEIRDGRTNQTELTRWTELRKAQPRLTQSDMNEYQQVEPSLIRTEPLPQSSPVQTSRQYTEFLPKQELYFTKPQQQPTPKLLVQPEGGAYSRGSRVTLTAHFENATQYQWCKDGVKLEGCVGNTLAITNAYLGNTGEYTIYAMNSNNFHSVKTEVIIY